jgi:hypothetical protein
MALKGKKLHSDDIQGITGFVMAYKGLAIFTTTYKELTLHLSKLYQLNCVSILEIRYSNK